MPIDNRDTSKLTEATPADNIASDEDILAKLASWRKDKIVLPLALALGASSRSGMVGHGLK